MSIGFWIKGECALSLDGTAIHPRDGDTVRLDVQNHKGYYRVKSLAWSYRQIPVAISGKPPMEDNRLEVNLVSVDA